jgi:serine phosphatase RsbU (regulator of sigma subunit)
MLTDEEKGKLDAMKDSLRTPREPGAPRPSAEEMAAQEEAYAKKVEAVLTPDQVKRLHEIRIQLMGARALHLKSVQEDLGLSAEQISKLKTIYDTFNAANASVRQKQQSQEIDRATARADQAKNLEELKTESEKVLTAEQLTKFQGMGGKTFTPTVPAGRGGN